MIFVSILIAKVICTGVFSRSTFAVQRPPSIAIPQSTANEKDMQTLTYSPIAWAIFVATGCVTLGAAPAEAQQAAVGELDAVTVVGSTGDLLGLDFYAPNSSTVLRAKDIEAQGARKLDEVLQYQAGIFSEPFGADNKVEWFKIRGFDASTSLDGTPTTPNGYFVWKPEIFGVEAVEVLKGPSALEFGASDTGGVVNLVTKRPHKEESLLMNLETGHRNRLGLGIDYNGIANDQGNVYYRIVAQTRRADGMQRETDMKSYYLAPSLTVDFSDRTSLTLLASIQREDGRPTNGFLPAYGTLIDTPYGKIDRRLNAGEPGFDHLKRTQISAGWLFSHKLSPDWTFTQNYKFSYLDLDQQNVYANGSDGDHTFTRGYTLTDGITRNHYIDHRLKGRVRLSDSVEILPAVGIDYLKSNTSGRNNGLGMAPPLDMFNPVYGQPFPVTADPYDIDTRQLGLYASAQARVGSHWNFNAGIRNDHAKSNSMIAGARAGYDMSHNSVNVGAMYISDYGVSPYVSYSESFKPQSGADSKGNTYQPYVGKQKEVGIKLEPDWLDGTLTLAYFDIEEKNALISDASGIMAQSGKRTNRGVELQGDFRITSRTGIKTAYTYNHARQDINGGLTIRTPMIPRHQASIWIDHRFDMPRSGALTVGAGARYNSSTEDQQYNRGLTVPGYTLFDLMARYQIDRNWSLQMNARNLTDKTYVSTCSWLCYYGGERTVDMQLQYQWR